MNGFGSRMRLSNSGAYKPATINKRRNDLIFLGKSTPITTADWPSSALGRQTFFRRSPPLPCVLTLLPATLSSSHLRRNQSGPRHTEKVGHWVTRICGSSKWATAQKRLRTTALAQPITSYSALPATKSLCGTF